MRIGLQSWGSEGDIRPFTALAAGLAGAGHDVTLVVTDNSLRDYRPHAERSGYRLVDVPNPAKATPAEVAQLWRKLVTMANPIRQAEWILRFGFDPAADAIYDAARELCAESDLVIAHFFVYPLRVAAEKAGVPVATVQLVHNCLPSAYIRPPGTPAINPRLYPLAWRIARTVVNRLVLPRANALRIREGLPRDTDAMLGTWATDDLNMVAVSPTICQAPSDWDARHRVCGFLNPAVSGAPEPVPNALEAFLEAGEPPVYLGFGSMMAISPEYARETAAVWLEAVRRAGCRAILQIPWDDPSIATGGERVHITRRAPHTRVFPRCTMVVHHGGAGTTQSSLLSGRPSLVVAHLSDQLFWGSELERLGVAGRTLTLRRLSPKRLAAGIAAILAQPDMATRAAALGARMAGEDGVGTAVRVLEARFPVRETP